MYSFGKKPPRSVDSFGVSGLLGDECRVFYDSIYSTRHLGRVSDLLAARLRKAQPDELKLRALLLYTVFEAYMAHTQGRGDAPEVFAEPLVVECGIDAEKVAIGASFTLAEGFVIPTEGMAERISTGQPDGAFELLIYNLLHHANRVVVRSQPMIRRFEVIGVMGLPGKMDEATMNETPALEVVVFETQPDETPKASAYVELGDLDYPTLLREDSPGAVSAEGDGTGNSLVKALGGDVFRVSGKPEESSELADAIRLRGDGAEAAHSTKVSGGRTAAQLAEVLRFKGDQADMMDQTMLKIKSDGPQMVPEPEQGGQQAQMFVQMIDQLQKKIELIEMDRQRARTAAANAQAALAMRDANAAADDNAPIVVQGDGPGEEEAPIVVRGQEGEGEVDDEVMIVEGGPAAPKKKKKSIWPFGKGEAGAAAEEEDDTIVVKATPGGEAESGETSEMIREMQASGLEKTLKAAADAAAEVKDDGRSKRFVDSLMGNLAAEKGRLTDLAKKLTTSIRVKELEYRNKEQSMTEEIRRRDEMLKLKNSAVSRLKDQLAQTTLAIERLKAGGGAGGEETHIKQRYAHVQKMLQASKDENTALTQKVEELRGQLSTANFTPKSRGPSYTDYAALQTKFDRAQRQAEELKKTNQQILDRLNETKKEKGSSTASVEEMKKRLEAAMKLVSMNKKDTEKKDAKLAELSQEEMRLKQDLVRTQGELKTLRALAIAKGIIKGAKPGSEAA